MHLYVVDLSSRFFGRRDRQLPKNLYGITFADEIFAENTFLEAEKWPKSRRKMAEKEARGATT